MSSKPDTSSKAPAPAADPGVAVTGEMSARVSGTDIGLARITLRGNGEVLLNYDADGNNRLSQAEINHPLSLTNTAIGFERNTPQSVMDAAVAAQAVRTQGTTDATRAAFADGSVNVNELNAILKEAGIHRGALPPIEVPRTAAHIEEPSSQGVARNTGRQATRNIQSNGR